jgi:hypothetical protein
MEKDRFSNKKKSNYSNEFRWGVNVITEQNKSYVKRLDISKNELGRIKKLMSYKLTTWEREFCNSIIKQNKTLTLKQKEVVIKLEKKYFNEK